jgi:hypothetical protein
MAPGSAAVHIAARGLPDPPAPWETPDEPAPQCWQLALDEEDALPNAVPRPGARVRPLPVALGMANDACVHLDLAAGPGVITVEGDPAARMRLLQALAAQLDRPGSGASVTVTDGVHPHHRGERLGAVLRQLEDTPAPETEDLDQTTTEVVVCAAPGREEARRLRALAASGAVVCLAEGRADGHSWALRVDARGRVTAPELGLTADSAPLCGAVAATVRADRRRARRTSAATRRAPAASPPRYEAPDLYEVQEERDVPRQRTLPEPWPAARTVTGDELLSEPATAREQPTAASSAPGEG